MAVMLLCVQQDHEIARLYAETLTAEGYEVASAHDPHRALEMLSRQNPSLVILDAHLPRQDGFAIVAEMRRRSGHESTPVLLLYQGDVTAEILTRAGGLGIFAVESAPIQLDRLVELVHDEIGSVDSKSTALPYPNEGSLKTLPIPELVRALHVNALDGVLLLRHGRKKKAIEFRSGWPISVKSNLVSECFGSYLVDQGCCTQSDLDESIERMQMGEGFQGEILVAMEVLDEASVVSALQAHAREKFHEIFSWRDGQYRIRVGTHLERGSSSGIEGHPSTLIVEGIRRRFPLKHIDRYFSLHKDAFLVPTEGLGERVAATGLAEEEVRWLVELGGSTRLEALLKSPESIRRIVFAMISIELFSVRMDAGTRADSGSIVDELSRCATADPTMLDVKSNEALRVELAALANGMQNRDHYEVLDVLPTAPDEEISLAFERLVRQAHPERFHSTSSSIRLLASQVMDRVREAYSGIATANDRKRYAEELSRERRTAVVEEEGRRALKAETEYQRGEKLAAKRDYVGALLCFGRAMENFPSEGEYHAQYGWCLHLCHPENEVILGEALEHCRNGVKLAKDREKPYLLLGRLYNVMGQSVAAQKMFTRAVRIRPQCVEAMRELRILSTRRSTTRGVLKRIFRR